MSNILVTGGAGFIGSHLVDKLVSLENKVYVLDNLSTGNRENINDKIEWFRQDDLLHVNLENLISVHKIDYAYHLAAQINLRDSIVNPVNDCMINVIGTLKLLEACKKVGIKKFIYFSTGGAIYDEYAKRPWDEVSTEANPKSPYGISKMCAEEYVKRFMNNYTILRPANVYGPRQDPKGEAGVISIFSNCIKNDKSCHIFGNGDQTRDYIYVDDVVSAAVKCMNENYGTFNVSTEMETSLNDLVDLMYKISGKEKNIIYDQAIDGEMLKCCLSNDRLSKTGWKCNWTLADGLKMVL